MMGNKRITFDKQSNIYVDGEEYKGTSGLRHLIIMKKPTWDNPKTFEHTRPYTTYKWKEILSLFPSEHHGECVAVHFLPNDINSLEDRLGVLLGECQAGNKTATKNEIVPIIEELCKRKAISLTNITILIILYRNVSYKLSRR